MSRIINGLTVTAPGIFGDAYNEAEILGSVSWLWMHSESHRDAPLHTLPKLLLPPIKKCQFVMAAEGSKPVFYMSWALMGMAAERSYLGNAPVSMPPEDWCSGNRLWFLDWVAPFGHTLQLKKVISEFIFPDSCARALHHKGSKIGLRFQQYRGANINRQVASDWFTQNPVNYHLDKSEWL